MIRRDMTLTELRAACSDQFYTQNWFIGERFMGFYPIGTTTPPTARVRGTVPVSSVGLPHAVDLAHAYLAHPRHDCWRWFWWTADTDAKGRRIYVGGCSEANGWRFEIHRHLHITDQWATPT